MTSTRDALTILGSANPVPEPRHDRATSPGASQARTGSRPRIRLLVAATGSVAALAVAAGVVPLPWTHGTATPAAAAALDQAATAADITAHDEAAEPDQYWRISTEASNVWTSVGDSELGTTVRESSRRTDYVAVDGSRPSWVASGAGKITEVFAGDAEVGDPGTTEETWTTNLAPNDAPASWQTPNPAWLAALPRETEALRDRLYDDAAGHGRSHDGEVLVYVADVLRSGMVPADLRAALFRVLETVPGVDVLQRHDDGLVAIGRLETVDGERQEILIDPATGAYMGDRIVQIEPMEGMGSVPVGTVRTETRVTRTVVDHVPADVRAEAKHWTCDVTGDGGVACHD